MKLTHMATMALAVAMTLTGCDQKPPAPASSNQNVIEQDWPKTLLTKYDCLQCHTPATRLVGPSYLDVATKYQDDPAAIEHIIGVIKKGSKGVWGDVPMPPHPQVPEPDARRLAEWVMKTR